MGNDDDDDDKTGKRFSRKQMSQRSIPFLHTTCVKRASEQVKTLLRLRISAMRAPEHKLATILLQPIQMGANNNGPRAMLPKAALWPPFNRTQLMASRLVGLWQSQDATIGRANKQDWSAAALVVVGTVAVDIDASRTAMRTDRRQVKTLSTCNKAAVA